MTPQPVVIYGHQCLLQKAGGSLIAYAVTDSRTGAVITTQPTRFMAVAKAAQALLSPRT